MNEPRAADTFSEQAKLNAYLAQSQMLPQSTSFSVVNTLRSLNDMYKAAETNQLTPEIKQIWENEAAMISRGFKAIASDPVLQARLGNGLSAVEQCIPLLKQCHNESYVRSLLEPHAWTDADRAKLTKAKKAFA